MEDKPESDFAAMIFDEDDLDTWCFGDSLGDLGERGVWGLSLPGCCAKLALSVFLSASCFCCSSCINLSMTVVSSAVTS